MDLLTYNTNIYSFLLISLLVWFLRALYALQLWFFFFFANILVNVSYFSFFSNNPNIGFIVIYLAFCAFTAAVVDVCQFSLFFFIWSLNNTNNSYLENIGGQGAIAKGFKTASLYLPVVIATPVCNALLSLQVIAKIASLILILVFLNFLV